MRTKISMANSSIRNICGLIVASTLSVFATSCSSESESKLPVESKFTPITLGASISEDADTRLIFKEDKLTWSKSDILYVYGAESAFTFNAEADKVTSASFTGAIDLSLTDKVYAIFDLEDGGLDHLTKSGDKVEYALTQQAAQDQNMFENGSLNTSSVGREVVLYGVSEAEISEDNLSPQVTLKHATAVQDFVFTNLPSHIAKLEFVSSEPFLTTATLDVVSGVITPGESSTSTIAVGVNLSSITDSSVVNPMTVRVAILPQTVSASAEWDVVITFADGTKYIKQFGASASDYVYEAGGWSTISIDFNDMSECAPVEVLTLQNITSENTAGSDHWVVACGEIAKAGSPTVAELEQCMDVLAAAGRDIKITFSDVATLVTGLFKDNSDITVLEFPAATIVSNASAFEGCTNLRSVSMPLIGTGSKTNMGNKLFLNCTSLTSVNAPEGETGIFIPSAIATIGNYTFQNCSAITDFSAQNITGVGNYVFAGCASLSSLEIATTASSFTTGSNLFGASDVDDAVINSIDLVTGSGNGTTVEGSDWTVGSITYKGFKSITLK